MVLTGYWYLSLPRLPSECKQGDVGWRWGRNRNLNNNRKQEANEKGIRKEEGNIKLIAT